MFLTPGSRARKRPFAQATPIRSTTRAYGVTTSDFGATVFLGGNTLFTVSIGPASDYPPGFFVILENTDSGRGKTIAPNGITSFILWPSQTVTVYNNNAGAWMMSPYTQVWQVPSGGVTLNVAPGGSNSNDGLSASAPLQTLAGAATVAYANIYTRNQGGITIDGGNNTFQEFVSVFYPMNGGGTLIFQNMSWKPPNSSFCLQHGDGALVGITNVTFLTTGVTSPSGIFIAHNHGILDVNASVVFNMTVGVSGSLFDHDNGGGGGSQININNGFTIGGGAANTGFLFRAQQPGMRFNINGTINFNNTTWGRFAWASQPGTCIVLNGNVSFNSAGGGISVSVSLVNQNASIQNLSGATLPGGTPTPTTGGIYNTTTSA